MTQLDAVQRGRQLTKGDHHFAYFNSKQIAFCSHPSPIGKLAAPNSNQNLEPQKLKQVAGTIITVRPHPIDPRCLSPAGLWAVGSPLPIGRPLDPP